MSALTEYAWILHNKSGPNVDSGSNILIAFMMFALRGGGIGPKVNIVIENALIPPELNVDNGEGVQNPNFIDFIYG